MAKTADPRACPAVNRVIPAAECEACRVSRYACPADCQFNPFAPANYSQLLAIERQLDLALLNRLVQEYPADEPLHDAVDAHFAARASMSDLARILFALSGDKDKTGRNLLHRWIEIGDLQLDNDAAVLLKAKASMQAELLEVNRVFDDVRFEVIDRLQPQSPSRLTLDRAHGSRAVRFQNLLAFTYQLPHYLRLAGVAVALPDIPSFDPDTLFTALALHLGAPQTLPALRTWLFANLPRFSEALHAVVYARREQALKATEALFSTASYTVDMSNKEFTAILQKVPDIHAEAPADDERAEGFRKGWVWMEPLPPSTPANPIRPSRGRILLRNKECRVLGIGRQRFADLRRDFEALLGPRVRFLTQTTDDLTSRMPQTTPPYDRSLVPPELLDHPESLSLSVSRVLVKPGVNSEQVALESAARRYLDEPVPLLNNRTPREAAADPHLRPLLIHQVKSRLRQADELNAAKGCQLDLNWMPKELGLPECDVPPPPPRPRQPAVEQHGTPQPLKEYAAATLPLAPALGPVPLSREQTLERLKAASNACAQDETAEQHRQDSLEPVYDCLEDLLSQHFPDEALDTAAHMAAEAWLILVPPGYRGPNLHAADLDSRMAAMARLVLSKPPKAASPTTALVDSNTQPHVLEFVLLLLQRYQAAAPRRLRHPEEQMWIITLFVAALIDAVCDGLRQRHRD